MTPTAVIARLAAGAASLAFLFLAIDVAAGEVSAKTPAGFAFTAGKNFVAGAPTKALAGEVLEKADALRRSIAREWLGGELPPGEAFTIIHVETDAGRDEGLTLLAGTGVGGSHRMWLRCSRQRATGTTLAHELAHVVLSTRFPEGMPAWANEGIASLYDDAERHRTRRAILQQMARDGNWPSLDRLLPARSIRPSDEASYAVSVSLTEFLLSRGSKPQFLAFVADGQSGGWNAALDRHYGVAGVADLQRQWQNRVSADRAAD